MRAVTGRYQKQKHISRHSFKLSTIYHIIARPGSQCSLDNKFGLLWEKKLIHLSFHETLPDVKGGKLHKNFTIYLQCGRLEGVAMFSVLIESLGKRTRVREWFIGMGEEYIRTFVFLFPRINLPSAHYQADPFQWKWDTLPFEISIREALLYQKRRYFNIGLK